MIILRYQRGRCRWSCRIRFMIRRHFMITVRSMWISVWYMIHLIRDFTGMRRRTSFCIPHRLQWYLRRWTATIIMWSSIRLWIIRSTRTRTGLWLHTVITRRRILPKRRRKRSCVIVQASRVIFLWIWMRAMRYVFWNRAVNPPPGIAVRHLLIR